MDRWCVSLDDLKQFKRLVGQAVSEGRICPTESLGLCIIYIYICICNTVCFFGITSQNLRLECVVRLSLLFLWLCDSGNAICSFSLI